MTRPSVGFIGAGIMGEPMAQHLLKAGYPLRVWNRTQEKLHPLIVAGAVPCADARSVVQGISTLICMLSDGPTCDDVLFGDGGVVAAMAPDTTIVVMSSIAVETAIEQARHAGAREIRYLDAPVSGGQLGARNASLAIMVGGAEEDFAATAPLLAVMGRPVRVGPVGCGQLSKLVNQMIVASTIAGVAEALLLAERGGADPAKVREALAGGFADSPILQLHAKRMIENDFNPGGTARWQLKDTRNAIAYSRSVGLSLPVANLVNSLFEEMVQHGDGELDHSGLIREIRRKNDIAVD
jgi:3-hydroxyisobutyrate dehydrogenase-like beta-hydroxyacid dehydrogenase